MLIVELEKVKPPYFIQLLADLIKFNKKKTLIIVLFTSYVFITKSNAKHRAKTSQIPANANYMERVKCVHDLRALLCIAAILIGTVELHIATFFLVSGVIMRWQAHRLMTTPIITLN